jgi:hypothetical protein
MARADQMQNNLETVPRSHAIAQQDPGEAIEQITHLDAIAVDKNFG